MNQCNSSFKSKLRSRIEVPVRQANQKWSVCLFNSDLLYQCFHSYNEQSQPKSPPLLNLCSSSTEWQRCNWIWSYTVTLLPVGITQRVESSLTLSGSLDVHRLKATIECWGINDVRLEVTVVLPVDEQGHHNSDRQTNGDSYHNPNVQRHIIWVRSSWKENETSDQLLLETSHRTHMYCSNFFRYLLPFFMG